MAKINLSDTATYVSGLGSGFAGITSIPALTSPMHQDSLLAAIVGLATMILQFLIIRWNRDNDRKRKGDTSDLLDLQRQINDLKRSSNDNTNQPGQ